MKFSIMGILNKLNEKIDRQIPDNENQSLNSINNNENENELSFSDVTEISVVGIVDLVNSTKTIANIPSSKIGKYYSIFLNTMSDIIKKHGGVVIKNIGDSLLLLPRTKQRGKDVFWKYSPMFINNDCLKRYNQQKTTS